MQLLYVHFFNSHLNIAFPYGGGSKVTLQFVRLEGDSLDFPDPSFPLAHAVK